jgi:hypothetical protein
MSTDEECIREAEDVKTILLPTTTKKSKNPKGEKNEKEKKDRVITHSRTWMNEIKEEDLTTDSQMTLLLQPFEPKNKKQFFIYSQIKQKINGYKHQDVLKNKLDAMKLVNTSFVVRLLVDSQLRCFYCKEPVNLLYKTVRDPKQWTLERVDNDYGHNKGNVEISCLSCNIKRRTMYFEKYRFTKQTIFVKET